MAAIDYARASMQTSLMLQKVNDDVKLSENLDRPLDDMFTPLPAEEIGLQQYRHPIQHATGGTLSLYNPDGGPYPQGNGPAFDQFVVAPIAMIYAQAETELSSRISNGGADVVIDNWVAKMIGKTKDKMGHFRNHLLQLYNNGVLATVTGVNGTTVSVAPTPFGARLLDKLNNYTFTDANYNILGSFQCQEKYANSLVNDSFVADNIPAGVGAGSLVTIAGMASGTPISPNGLNYIVNPTAALEYCGVSRANSYVQSVGYNAQGAAPTLAAVEVFKTRMYQTLGELQYGDRKNNVWYGHISQKANFNVQGFAKQMFVSTDGKLPNYDPFASMSAMEGQLAGMKIQYDSLAAIDKVYFLDKSTLRKVRYPGSQKFIEGPVGGLFWPRISGGLYTSERDVLYQDSFNAYSSLPWANGVMYTLGIQPGFSNN